jgi:hypothetical protein
MTHKVTVIVHEAGERRELIFTGVQGGGKGIEFNSREATLTLWSEKGNLLNERWVVPFVSHYCVEDELEW